MTSREGGDGITKLRAACLTPWQLHRKPILRTKALAARDALSEAQRAGGGAGDRRARAAGRDQARHRRRRLFADPKRNRSMPLMQALAARGARLALPAITARGQSLIFRAVSSRRPAAARSARHSRAVAGRGRNPSRHRAGAAGGLRPLRPPHRLRRRPLRPHVGASAQIEGLSRDRARLFGARNRGRAGAVGTTCRSIMC